MLQNGWNLPDPDLQAEFYHDVPMKRLFAFGIDTVITLALALLVVVMTAFVGVFFFWFLFGVVGFIYRVATISKHSATWGMRIMAIELRDSQGQRLDPQTAILHTTGFCFCMWTIFFQIVSVILMTTTQRGQGLSDHILGTVVLNRRASN